MQRLSLLVAIRRVGFVDRRQFLVISIDQVYKQVVERSCAIQSIVPMQNPLMSSLAFFVQILLFYHTCFCGRTFLFNKSACESNDCNCVDLPLCHQRTEIVPWSQIEYVFFSSIGPVYALQTSCADNQWWTLF